MHAEPADPAWDEIRRQVGPQSTTLLAALRVLDIRRRTTAEAVTATVGELASLEALGAIAQVELGGDRITIDDRLPDPGALLDHHALELATLAAVERTCASGDLSEAGRIATAGSSIPALRSVLRAALRVQPPLVSAHDLRSWRDALVLEPHDPHEWWLDATCRSLLDGPSRAVFDLYEQARIEFADRRDFDAELEIGMAAAIIARRLDDLGAVAAFIVRANEMVAEGYDRALGAAQLGVALVHQMAGDPDAALSALDAVPADSFEGDWAAQLSMMRGTNLMLSGRLDDAVAHLIAATGSGGPWSYAVSLELLATARWRLDDRVGAVRDMEVAEEVARSVGATVDLGRIRAQRAAMLAADDDPAAAAMVVTAVAEGALDDEAERILRVAQVLVAVESDDLDRAADLASSLDAPERAVRSTHWTVPLQTALAPATLPRWNAVVASHEALLPALDAGRAAAAHLAGGPLAPRRARPFLPSGWCEPAEPVIELHLLGGATVLRDRRPVRERSWERGRVRELCCYLALVENSSRDLTAERLWPDLTSEAASKNLRVTLSYLLDVLEPDRVRGAGTDLVTERDGVLTFAMTDRLRIDLRELLAGSRAVLAAALAGDERTVVRDARQLARLPRGPLLGGAAIGDWAEPYEHARRELVLRAVSAGGPIALRAGDADLAEALARRGLDEDPWAERLHQLVVRSCLARDDLDAARRALRHAWSVIAELGVRPERATADLARDVGLDLD